jgi:hypothetical protein
MLLVAVMHRPCEFESKCRHSRTAAAEELVPRIASCTYAFRLVPTLSNIKGGACRRLQCSWSLTAIEVAKGKLGSRRAHFKSAVRSCSSIVVSPVYLWALLYRIFCRCVLVSLERSAKAKAKASSFQYPVSSSLRYYLQYVVQ